MTITAMADRLVTVHRRTPLVLDAVAAAASYTVSRQPARAACIQVTCTGGASGTFTVTGTVDGVAGTTETLTLVAEDKRATRKLFSAISALASTGLAGATVQAEAVGRDGSREHGVSEQVVTSWPMRFDRTSGHWPNSQHGGAQTEQTKFYLDYTAVWTPREGDVLVDNRTAEQWFVIGVPTLHSASVIPHHWELHVRRREGSTGT